MTPKSTGSRAELRANQTAAIKVVARRLIADQGVADLSLREVSREMGMVSSALYRYFATRDELLTALIFDAYSELGAVVEKAESKIARGDTRARWRAACAAVRKWATSHPHEYALLYGTPVPGYLAPNVTIAAATRVPGVLGRILSDDVELHPRRRLVDKKAAVDVRPFLQVDALTPSMPNVAPEHFVRALMAWTNLFGTVSFELFGHYVGSVTSYRQFFDRVVEELADFAGLA
jgi:AcrR family transcriptional regulator